MTLKVNIIVSFVITVRAVESPILCMDPQNMLDQDPLCLRPVLTMLTFPLPINSTPLLHANRLILMPLKTLSILEVLVTDCTTEKIAPVWTGLVVFIASQVNIESLRIGVAIVDEELRSRQDLLDDLVENGPLELEGGDVLLLDRARAVDVPHPIPLRIVSSIDIDVAPIREFDLPGCSTLGSLSLRVDQPTLIRAKDGTFL